MSVESFVVKVTRLAKKRRGLTQKAIAPMIGVHPSRLSNWKKGVGAPTFAQAIDLCRIAGASFDYLLDESPGDEPAHARPLDADDLLVLGAFRGSPLSAREVTDLIRDRVRAANGGEPLPVGTTHRVGDDKTRRNHRTG